jgi:O-antigen/teichoic acid export membrane protein
MRKILNKLIYLSQTATAKNTYIVFIGNSLAAFLGMISMIIVSRKLGPAGFGVFSVSFALASLVQNVGDLGLNFALIKNISQYRVKGKLEKIEEVFWTVFWAKLFFCFILGAVGLFFINFISVFLLKSPETVFYNKLIFIFLFFSVFFDLVKSFFQAKKMFIENVVVYILANFFKLIFVALVVIWLPTFQNFILIYLITPLLGTLLLFKKTNLKLRLKFYWQEFGHLMQFASWIMLSVIVSAIAENLNIFMVSSYLDKYQTGIYSAAEKFILPISIWTGAIATVLISRTSEFLELKHIKAFIKKIILLQFVMIFLFLLALPFSGLVPVILGKQYVPSVVILQILIIASYFRSAITPLNSTFYPLNKSIIFAIDSVLEAVLLFSLNRHFLPLYQAKGAALSLVLTNITIFIFNYIFLFYQLKKYGKKTSNLGA